MLILIELVGLTFGGVRLGVIQWIALTGLLWVTALPFAVLGVFVGFMVNAETAYPVVTALMFVLGYFGGLFNPVSQMPQALQSAAKVLPSFHHALLALEFLSGQTLGAANWLVLLGYTIVLGMALVWKHRVEESRGLA
jgi:ABC-2 type transport system permease protein